MEKERQSNFGTVPVRNLGTLRTIPRIFNSSLTLSSSRYQRFRLSPRVGWSDPVNSFKEKRPLSPTGRAGSGKIPDNRTYRCPLLSRAYFRRIPGMIEIDWQTLGFLTTENTRE